ncbi:MAG: efflux RND transporter periplasmic adaptor subunit [Myxococcaceae bacterium]|nr:efflux RND transporter periplasmic adaptor subunit [Myxococcaceae bacterium]
MDSRENTMVGPPPKVESPVAVPSKAPKGRGIIIGAVALVVVGLAAFFLTRGSKADANAAGPGNDAPVIDGQFIRYSDAFATRAGITTEAVRVESLSPIVTVTGTMKYDPRRFAAIGARITGRVKKLHKVVGDKVKAKEPVAELESAELGRAEAAVLSARAKEKAAEADMKRERRLADAHISPERDAEASAATYEAARADRIAAERAVEALGGDLDNDIGIMTLRAPIDGRVVALEAARGQTLETSDTIYQVADLSVLWVELTVYERDISAIRVGDKVDLTPQTGAPVSITGVVEYVGDVIDPDTHAAHVRVVVPNEPQTLRPGQSVVARIATTGPATSALSVPKAALTRVDGKPTVFISHDKNTVEPRIVQVGAEDAERVAVLQGLKDGDQIVLKGMFALKSEIYR